MSTAVVSKVPDVTRVPLGELTAADAAVLARLFPPVKTAGPLPVAAFNSAL